VCYVLLCSWDTSTLVQSTYNLLQMNRAGLCNTTLFRLLFWVTSSCAKLAHVVYYLTSAYCVFFVPQAAVQKSFNKFLTARGFVSKGWEVTNLEEARLAALLSYVPNTMGGGVSTNAASAGDSGKGGSGRGTAEVCHSVGRMKPSAEHCSQSRAPDLHSFQAKLMACAL
jgi:hypothetical protein